MRRNQGGDRQQLTATALAAELGFGVAGPLVGCTGLGWYLDGLWGTGHWLVVTGLLIGLVSTFGTFYRLATAFPAQKPAKPRTPRPDGSADKTDGTPGGP